jgi:hypothetical protein
MFDAGVWEAAQLVTRSKKDMDGAEIVGGVEALSTYHERVGVMKEVVERAEGAGVPVLKWCLMEVLERCPAERVCERCELWEECGGRAKERCDGFFSIDDAIRMKKRVSRETWETEMMCMRPGTKGAVFKHFEVGKHVVEELPSAGVEAQRKEAQEGLFLGVDFGYRNPFVCLWIRRDAWGRSFVIDEYVQEEKTIFEHIEEIKARAHGDVKRLYCDPAGNGPNDQTGKTNVEQLRKHFTVRSRASLIQDGIELIRAALCSGVRQATLFIHPRCKRLVAAMQNYHYKEIGGGENPEKDGNDHLTDALRYYFVNAQVGELVGRNY